MSINAGSVYSELILNGDKYFSTLDKADKETKSFEKRLKGYGDNLEKVGKGLTIGVTTPIVGLGTVATKTAIDFESAFAGVIKTVDATDTQLSKLETGIRDMSKEIPASATAISEVAEAAGQLGIETDNILGFTRVMIDLGEATNLSADDAATALARLANITGMSQQDFDRLGSTIVDLGNNLATTESEIVAMGLRLAGAGAQIGLTEAQIMSFAGALSSVGIEAEAGGSAFSKVMIEMQLAVETNSKKLDEFANVAGMSASEFKKAFQEDAAGAIITFNQGLGNAEEKGMSAIKILDDMGISEVRLRDALLRASGASDVFTESLKIGTNAWDENTALTKEAEQRYKTTASQIEIAKNYLKDAGITTGEIVVPHLISLAEKIKNVSEWFSNLNPKTQESIVKMAGLAAATGPVLYAGGKMVNGLGSIIGLFNKFGVGAKVATTAAGTLGGASGLGSVVLSSTKAGGTIATLAGSATGTGGLLGGLTTGLGTSLAAMGPWAAGATAAAGAGYLIYKELNERVIPEVEMFDETISEATKSAVENFLDMEKNVTTSLNQLSWSGQEVTEEMKENIVGNFEEMKNNVISELEQQKEEALSSLNELFSKSKDMTEEEKEELIRITAEKYDEQIRKTEEGNNRISEILETAKEENRTITEEEKKEILKIKEDLKEDSIRLLSETQEESETILENLKKNAGTLTAEMAAEVVKNSLEQKEETIKNAEEEYQERLNFAETLRKDGSKESEELADKVVEEAKRQRDEAILAAEEMHERVVEEAQSQAKDHIDAIDWESGELMSKWDQLKNWFSNNPIIRRIFTKDDGDGLTPEQSESFREGVRQRHAHGTNFFGGGWTWVGEQGPEIVELPKGSKIYSNQKSMEMVKGASGGITQNIHIHSPEPLSPSETARKNLQASRQLAMEWGL